MQNPSNGLREDYILRQHLVHKSEMSLELSSKEKTNKQKNP